MLAGARSGWVESGRPFPEEPVIRLRILERDKPPVEFNTTRSEIVLGRSPDCDVVVNHPYVSGRHLRVLAGVVVEDLGSSNGTFLDDNRLETPSVIGNARLTVGGPVIRLEVIPDEPSDIAQTQSGDGEGSASAGELQRLRARIVELETQLARKEQAGVGKGSTAPPTSGAALLEELVAKDFSHFDSRLDGPIDEFYLIESFRMLRWLEKAVTRMAGELTTKLSMHTALPNADGNLLGLFAEVLVQPNSARPRQELVDYLSELRRWMSVILSVYQKASVQFSDEMRESLSPMKLAQAGPIPAPVRWLRQEEKILWRRARAYLDGLTPEGIGDRLDQLAKTCAKQMLR